LTRVYTAFLWVCFATVCAVSQDLPKTVLGYKLHRTKVVVAAAGANTKADVAAELDGNVETDISLLGPVVLVPLALTFNRTTTGTLDRLRMRGLKVNGVDLYAEDIVRSFDVKPGTTIRFTASVRPRCHRSQSAQELKPAFILFSAAVR
jgi:hypothetical protein